MKVKYLDLPGQFNDEGLWELLKKQFQTCQFIMGPELEAFESHFSRLCGTVFALGVSSGTDAIFLALKALGIGLGDEVITIPNSFIATAGAIVASGSKPVFVDVGPDYNIDVDLIRQAITPRTKAIMPVHLTGNPADMPRIMGIARENHCYVIEDAAQAVTALIEGQTVGSFGNIGCFSLHPLKNLNVCGDGGVLTTNSEAVYKKLDLLRNHGLKNRDEIEIFGYNSRMDTIKAAVANYFIEHLETVTKKRQRNALIYDKGLKEAEEFVIIPPRRKGVKQVFHTYVVQVEKRDELVAFLYERGVETRIHYPIPIHLQKPCKKFGYHKGDFPVCEMQSGKILSLPIHQYLSEQQINYVIDMIMKFYKIKS
ncbi:DegT/DnrJ/EryC1/StrS family aminotransferase [Thermodesulfobacteriota bacterium]